MLHSNLTRRTFFAGTTLTCAALAVPSTRASAMFSPSLTAEPDSELHSGFPSQDQDDVRAVVGASHGNFDLVKELVTQRPALAKCAYDWGFGDWESALGAASHMARRDIAEFLIAHGARPNLFTYAMLGQVDAVRAIVQANPGIQRSPGPHGIPLLAHARQSGPDAQRVTEYLEELGDAGSAFATTQLSADERADIMGSYRIAADNAPALSVIEMRNGLPGLKVGDGFGRALMHRGDLEFHPTGAEHVRINFAQTNGTTTALTIHDGPHITTAQKIT